MFAFHSGQTVGSFVKSAMLIGKSLNYYDWHSKLLNSPNYLYRLLFDGCCCENAKNNNVRFDKSSMFLIHSLILSFNVASVFVVFVVINSQNR